MIFRKNINSLILLSFLFCSFALYSRESSVVDSLLSVLDNHVDDTTRVNTLNSLAETIREKYNLPFIFITSHSDAATVERAKSVHPDGYLVKPFEKKDLYTSIEIAFSNFISKEEKEVEKENSFFLKDSIFIRKDYLLIKIRFNELRWVKSDGNYLDLYCKDEKHLVQRLPASRFLQVHKSYLVNLEHIRSIDHRYVRIDDDMIPIGRAFLDDIKKILDISFIPTYGSS